MGYNDNASYHQIQAAQKWFWEHSENFLQIDEPSQAFLGHDEEVCLYIRSCTDKYRGIVVNYTIDEQILKFVSENETHFILILSLLQWQFSIFGSEYLQF